MNNYLCSNSPILLPCLDKSLIWLFVWQLLLTTSTVATSIRNCSLGHEQRAFALFTIFGQCWVVGFKQRFTACTGCHALLHPIVLHSLTIRRYTGERFSWHDLEETGWTGGWIGATLGSIDRGVGERAVAVLEIVSDHLCKGIQIYWMCHHWHESDRTQQGESPIIHDRQIGGSLKTRDQASWILFFHLFTLTLWHWWRR